MSRSGGLKRTAEGLGRRRILAGVGASGLAAAIAVFGRSGSAAAAPSYRYGCCNLAFAPSGTLSSCLSGSHYVWYCGLNELQCECCEVKGGPNGAYSRSVYTCY